MYPNDEPEVCARLRRAIARSEEAIARAREAVRIAREMRDQGPSWIEPAFLRPPWKDRR
jgi:hypothetical protein